MPAHDELFLLVQPGVSVGRTGFAAGIAARWHRPPGGALRLESAPIGDQP